MGKKSLEKIFEEAFSFLNSEYAFNTASSKKEDWGYYFTAVNPTTGIEIKYEFKEAYVQVIVYRLIDGKIVRNITKAIKNNEPISGFSLEWIIALKNPEAQIKPAFDYGIESKFYDNNNGFKNYVEFVAKRLREYAAELLQGDFTSFSKLDEMVKKQYKDYYGNRGRS
jgi:hypothetical protein